MARKKNPSVTAAGCGDTSPCRGGQRKDNITVVGFLILEDGRKVPMEDLTPEQREAWKARCCERLSQRLSDYFTNHPEEYARF